MLCSSGVTWGRSWGWWKPGGGRGRACEGQAGGAALQKASCCMRGTVWWAAELAAAEDPLSSVRLCSDAIQWGVSSRVLASVMCPDVTMAGSQEHNSGGFCAGDQFLCDEVLCGCEGCCDLRSLSPSLCE